MYYKEAIEKDQEILNLKEHSEKFLNQIKKSKDTK